MSASLAIHTALSSDQLLTPAMIAAAQRVIDNNRSHRVGFRYAGQLPSSKQRFAASSSSFPASSEFKPLTQIKGVNDVAA